MDLAEKLRQLHGVGQMRAPVDRRHSIPSFQCTDGPHGVGEATWRYLGRHLDRATSFPVGLALASTFDAALAERVGAAIAREARAKGRNWLLAPTVDLARDPRAGRTFETFGEDPRLTAALAAAYVRGAQSEGVIATPKHLVCHEQESFRRGIDVQVGERALRELHLLPFEACVEAGALAIMAASHAVGGVPMTEHARLIQEVVRGEWGFRGIVVSDWRAMRSTEASIRAGLDVEMPYARYYGRSLGEALRAGRVDPALVDAAARRVLETKLAAGLFERERALEPELVGCAEHRELALEVARASIVLLADPRGFLPFEPRAPATLAVLGPAAAAPRLSGRGSSEVRPVRPLTPLAGLRALAPAGLRVLHARGTGSAAQLERARALAREADATVLFVGLDGRDEGEARDRAHLALPPEQAALVEAVLEASARVVLCVLAGSPVDLAPYVERAAAVLCAWYPGELGGQALAEVLLGLRSPAGRLPLTWPRSIEQVHGHERFPDPRPVYDEGVFLGYRHFDRAGLEPLFPFGHGLSYARFEWRDLEVGLHGAGAGLRVEVALTLANTGGRAGAEVVQLYLSDLEASVPRPSRELVGFERVELAPGEERRVRFDLGRRALAFWDEGRGGWTVEPGGFELVAGASSRDARLDARFELEAAAAEE